MTTAHDQDAYWPVAELETPTVSVYVNADGTVRVFSDPAMASDDWQAACAYLTQIGAVTPLTGPAYDRDIDVWETSIQPPVAV